MTVEQTHDVQVSRYPADFLSTLPTRELQTRMREARSLPLAALLNRGGMTVDYVNQRVWRDSYWKGSFAKDTLLGWEERILTPIRSDGPRYVGGRFWKRFDTIEGGEARGFVINYGIRVLPGRPVVRMLQYPDDKRSYVRAGDEVMLLSYLNQPYRVVYDLIKVVDQNNCIGVMHLGRFPQGRVFGMFVMSRNNYPYAKMSVPDHDALIVGDHSRVPSAAEVAGSWNGHLVFLKHPELALHNQFNPPIIKADFDAGAEGLHARVRVGLFASSLRASTSAEWMTLSDGKRRDEVRMVGADTLLGRQVSSSGKVKLRYVLSRGLSLQVGAAVARQGSQEQARA